MSPFGALLLTIVVVFGAVIWPTRKAAQLVGAERTGYGTVLLALMLSIILMVGLGIVLGLGVARGGSVIGAYLVLALAQVFLYSKVFGTEMLKALLIWLIAQVIGALLGFALAAILGVGGFLFGDAENERVAAAVDAACACEGDHACLDMQKAVVAAEVQNIVEKEGPSAAIGLAADMQRLKACVEDGVSARPRAQTDSSAPATAPAVSAPAPESEPAAQAQPKPAARTPKVRYSFVWQEARRDQLITMVGEMLRVELADGRKREGILVSVAAGTANLRSATSRGLDYHVDLTSVKTIEVRKSVAQ